MNKKLIMTGCLVSAVFAVWAMPTKRDLKKAQEIVSDVIAADVRALKDGSKTPLEIASVHRKLAGEASSEAERYLLLQSAFKLYARGEAYAEAADVLAQLEREIPNVPPKLVVELVSKEMGRVAGSRAPRLLRQFKAAKALVRGREELKVAEEQVRMKPQNAKFNENLGIARAKLGDWPGACAAFLKAKGEVAKRVKEESGENPNWAELADFWWGYNRPDDAKDDEQSLTVFQYHAAELYDKALWAGTQEGLSKVAAERRLAEARSADEFLRPPFPTGNGDRYCIIDLSNGPQGKSYPVTYAGAAPIGGWSDVYKTSKIVLRKVDAGDYKVGDLEKDGGKHAIPVKFSAPYYVGVFGVTQRQWELVMGNRPSMFTNAVTWARRPVEQVTYTQIRGSKKGLQWPLANEVDEGSFMGRLRQRTNLGFDLPTEAQWEVACRAGTTTPFAVGHGRFEDRKKYWRNMDNGFDHKKWGAWWEWPWCVIANKDRGSELGTAVVGSYPENNWGFYDMQGNVLEWCVNRYENDFVGGYDPVGPVFGGFVLRGGSWLGEDWGSSFNRRGVPAGYSFPSIGFRLCMSTATFKAPRFEYATASGQAKFALDHQQPASVRTLNLATGLSMDYVYCPAGTFKMGYVDAPEIAPLRDVTITRPFWISKGHVTGLQLGAVQGDVYKAAADAVRLDNRQQADEYVAQFQKKFGSLLPKGYVFRLPTEAEWEYVAKSGAKEAKGELFSWKHDYRKNPLKNAWGVAGLCEPTKVAFFDKIPMSDGKGAVKADIAHHDNILTGIDYSKASDKDPCAWSGDAQARTLRRIVTSGRGDNQKLSSLCEQSDSVWVFFHLVIAPDPATLNKFEIK